MKLNNQLPNNLSIPLNSATSPFGDFILPLKPVKIKSKPFSELDLTLYSHQGFIKGISALNNIKKLKYGFSTKRFGNMAFKYGEVNEVVKNRKGFVEAVGINFKNTVFMLPNHGKGIDVVDSSHRGRGSYLPGTSVGPADALITFDKNVALGLNSADCVPLIMTTKNVDVLALVHAGRIGTDANIAKTTIKKLITFGIKPQDLIVGVGPAIQKSCYKLDYLETDNPTQWLPWIQPVLKLSRISTKKNKTGDKKYKIRANEGQIMVDIIGFNIAQLLEMGVKSENIDITPVCALCMARKDEIFSHFFSGQFTDSKLYPEGRFMSIAQLK